MLKGKNLCYHRPDAPENSLFRNLNFSLSSGQLVLIQGNNGTGKTTLLKMVAGLILPEKGCITWNGENITRCNEQYRANISYLAHKDGLRKALTLYENLVCHLTLNANGVLLSHMEKILKAFGLYANANTRCQALSAGQRRKVRLVGIILSHKKLWILDEPFTFLDKRGEEVLREYFLQHLAQDGMIIMASHQMQEKEYCHSIINL